MRCELNIQGRSMAAHDAESTWIATNKNGVAFRMCAGCVETFKKNHPDWEKRGVKFEPLERSPHAVV